MTMMGEMRVITLSIAVVLILAGAAQAQPQTKEKQACINAMNKDAVKVYVTRGKEDIWCARTDAVQDATTDLDACLAADLHLKVKAKTDKTTDDEIKHCNVVGGTPDFGYSDAATINSMAVQIQMDLIEDMFKDPGWTTDDGMFPCDPYPNECSCQRTVHKVVEKLLTQIGKKFNKCKKNALLQGKVPFPLGADDPNDLMDCVDNPSTSGSVAEDSGGKLALSKQKIADAAGRGSCNTLSIVANDPFPGPACNRTVLGGTPTDTQLGECLAQRVYCHFCRLINAADNLSVDCAAFSGGTCS